MLGLIVYKRKAFDPADILDIEWFSPLKLHYSQEHVYIFNECVYLL